ncbi:DUF3427 domain-containing protein [Cytobacillus oceanisediminis]|uniref:DUF3427 domain-containing protein n=1 Tax=Cytobacillus oceanisediminis TaxID=665099 RepID=UPI002494C8D8|nr:DEAD/DEAH box helicase [Cytobacillus oceanisediminis]
MSTFIKSLEDSLYKGFIDQDRIIKGNYPPKLLVNNSSKNEYVLTSIQEELEQCESFIFSVAFITDSGLATLKTYLLDLKQKRIKGRILTSTFLSFNHPKVFRELMKIENVEVRLTDIKGFHSKGYIFKQRTHFSLIVGSSNLTANALKVNYEWNVKLTSHENGEFIHHFKQQFEGIWEKSAPLTEDWINRYEEQYTPLVNSKVIDRIGEASSQYAGNAIEDALKIVPNKMQQAALQQIQALRNEGKKKGLIISATGTGKTYLSAFDVRRFVPKRMLFIVHREQILNKAKEDFRKILGGLEEDFGILSGTTRQKNARYLFATIQSISKDEHLFSFAKDDFDYILIDEVHKAGASSYHKVMEYFAPEFMMGMTATPERTDHFNIFELFDYNIAYEIRLQEALEEDMLCPFHYFGVTDFEFDGKLIDDASKLSDLVTEERVKHIIEKINYYGASGEKVRGLMFCSRKDEAKELSHMLNEEGFNTVVLTGEDSQEERERRVNQLEAGIIDYILTVDIFNEGIDIPSINQVVMLRQTKSSIIFIQQLGRGLRKHDSKEFVTIIDFIGNYKNNFLIPIALSGDKSVNEDTTRRYTKNTSFIKGVSTVNFEEVARKRIFDAINDMGSQTKRLLKDAYLELKNKIGRVPKLVDYTTYNSIDPNVIINEYTTYPKFLKVVDRLPISFSEYELKVISMLSIEVMNGKRMHEIILLNEILINGEISVQNYLNILKENNCKADENTLKSVERIFNLSFFTKTDQAKYGGEEIILLENGSYKFGEKVNNSFIKNKEFELHLRDICDTAFEISKRYMSNEPLKLYEKYSKKDVCRLLNWENDEKGTMYGYKTKHGTCPIFITYHKDESVEASIAYEDALINQEILSWSSRPSRVIESKELQPIIHAEDQGIEIHIFIKKDDGEGTGSYYLGKASPIIDTVTPSTINNGKGEKPIVKMNMIMETPVEYNLYKYLIAE